MDNEDRSLDEVLSEIPACLHEDAPTLWDIVQYAEDGAYPPDVHQCEECLHFFNRVKEIQCEEEEEE